MHNAAPNWNRHHHRQSFLRWVIYSERLAGEWNGMCRSRRDLYVSWERGRDTFDRLLIDADWSINNGAAPLPPIVSYLLQHYVLIYVLDIDTYSKDIL